MKRLALLFAALVCISGLFGSTAKALSLDIDVNDHPYYLHGPGYWAGRVYYVWVPGHWGPHHRVWIHGHYRVR
jgi:hypothetical protein